MSKKYSGNMLLSPISLKIVLVLLYEGAQDETAHELATAMQLPANENVIRKRFSTILQSLQVIFRKSEFRENQRQKEIQRRADFL